MNQALLKSPLELFPARAVRQMMFACFTLFIAAFCVHAQASAPVDDPEALVVEGMKNGDVFGLGRSVIVRGQITHGAMSIGGDVIVEGRVEGDVATIGGSVIQREGSYIGGDVIVIGGAYHHGKNAPGRNPASTTVMYAGYEQELRHLARNPATLFAPQWSVYYLGWRVLAVLFWFVMSLIMTAVMPGAVSRAVARLQLTSARVGLIGFLGAVLMTFGVLAVLRFLPTSIGALVGLTALLLMLMATVFGRVVINAATGRWLERKFLPEAKHSETGALFLGTSFWAVVLSLPYIWPMVTCGLLVASLGLALTARYRVGWKRA
ncbi:MAG TPA: hypothetical protein VF528_12500 [Pyrinomonadaceae bacterium]